MTQFLPSNLLALFAPREPIKYLPPPDKLPHEKKNVHNYSGVADFVRRAGFEDPKDTPPPVKVETKEERQERRRKEKQEQAAYKLEQEVAEWDPNSNSDGTEDPFKTLFVARINYYTSESKIRREFEAFGPIKRIVMVHDKDSGKPRGYCFIEYEHERDMHSAYKHADGMKIDGRRVLVDVERARTVRGWLPRRLGGGLGGTRNGGNDVNVRHSGRAGSAGGRHRDSKSRDRDRERRRRSKSREKRSRRRSKSRSKSRDRKRSRRSRSRERSKRSKSRDKKRSKRSRSKERSKKRDRSKDRERNRDRDKDRDKDRDRSKRTEESGIDTTRIKEEPNDFYGDEGNNGYYGVEVKQEVDEKPDISNDGYQY